MRIYLLCVVVFLASMPCIGGEYIPAYNPEIRYMSHDLKELIDYYAPDYYDRDWNLTLSQYKAWVSMIAIMEAGNLRGFAHSGSAMGRETFCHFRAENDFLFSTSLGNFQLGNGGGDENWGQMSTLDKLDSRTSLLSVLRWHKEKFGDKVTLSDFQRKSAWYAVKNTSNDFKWHWKLTTGYEWDLCKNKKIEVGFSPPTTTKKENVVKDMGIRTWRIGDQEIKLETWRISAKTFRNGRFYCFAYFYAYTPETGIEVWVWEKDRRYGFVRNCKNYLPLHVEGKTAGFSCEEPILN